MIAMAAKPTDFAQLVDLANLLVVIANGSNGY